MIRLSAGLAVEWVEWDGVVGDGNRAGQVTLDDRQVPLFATECHVASHAHRKNEPISPAALADHADHVARGELCVPVPLVPHRDGSGHTPPGFGWSAPMENGLWVEAIVDGSSSALLLRGQYDDGGPEAMRAPTIEVDLGAGTWWRAAGCAGHECPGCWHGWNGADFESFDEYLALCRQLGSLVERGHDLHVGIPIR